MVGLFGTLNLGQRSLSTQRTGVEVAGHNLANVNNPAYARQRVSLQTAPAVDTRIGPQGTGVEAVAIRQLRNALLDGQIQGEVSVGGYWEAQQSALQYAQANLGQQIDRQATGAEGATAASGIGGQQGIVEGLQDLFNAFQSLSTDPTSLAERQVLLQKAQSLAVKFNQADQRLGNLRTLLNESVQTDVTAANELITTIATLNDRIANVELSSDGAANDLRDLRQQKLEELSKLVKVDTATDARGSVSLTIAGAAIVTGNRVDDTLEAYDAGGGRVLVRAQASGAPLTLNSGSLQGSIDARDGAVANLRSDLNTLAGVLINEVNTVHAGGFSLTGGSGTAFFDGVDAATIRLNAALSADPAAIQAAGVAGAPGDNQVALALAQLADKRHAGLGNQTFSQRYGQTVAALGQSLAAANSQISDQQAVEGMLKQQRDAISGVSIDEEMTDLMKYQKAFEASARLITTVDELLETVINLKR